MENVIFGLSAILKLMRMEIDVIINAQIIQGFVFGFIVASLVYAFVTEGKARRNVKEEKKKQDGGEKTI